MEKEFNKRMAIQSTTDKSYRTFLDEIYKFKRTPPIPYDSNQLYLPPISLESPAIDIKAENKRQFEEDFNNTDIKSFDDLIDVNIKELERKSNSSFKSPSLDLVKNLKQMEEQIVEEKKQTVTRDIGLDEYLSYEKYLKEKGIDYSMDLDLIMPKAIFKVDDPDYQFEKKEAHMEFLYRNNLKNNYILNNVMEQSYQYFKDILELMLMLDYDIFRISLIMYRNFDFSDYKESYVKLTKILYKNQYKQIKDLNNLDRDILQIKKTYNSNQLWDEINIQTNPVWIMEFASFLRLDKDQYFKLIRDHTFIIKNTQNYQLWRLQRSLNFTDEQVKRFVLYRTYMMNDPNQCLYRLYVTKDLDVQKLGELNFRFGIEDNMLSKDDVAKVMKREWVRKKNADGTEYKPQPRATAKFMHWNILADKLTQSFDKVPNKYLDWGYRWKMMQ